MLFKIAWRNIWRSRTRSIVIILAITIGLWASIFLLAFSWGMNEQRVREAINNEVSHFQAHDPHFKDDYSARKIIAGGSELFEHLRQEEQVSAVTWRAIAMGMVASTTTSSSVHINGVAPKSEVAVTHLKDKLVEGEFFGQGRHPIIVSRKLADKLKVRLRSKIVLTLQDAERNIVSGAFKVVGIFQTNNSLYDESNIFVRGTDLQQLLGIGNGFHEIAVVIKQNEALDALLSKYRATYTNVLFESWQELLPEIQFMIDAFQQMMDIILFIILLTLAFGLVNIMLMAVLERVREIGVLMAIGMNKVKVFFMIMLETLFLSLAGGPLGILLGFLTVQLLGSSGINLSFYAEGLSSFGYGNLVFPALDAQYYFQIAVEVIFVTLIAAVYPAYKAIKLQPVEAIGKI